MPYHKWPGAGKAGQDGSGGPHAARAPGLVLPYGFVVSASSGGDKTLTEKTTAATAAADAGVVFYKYGGHRHQLFAARAGNNFLRCTAAEGGRERPAGRA